MPALELLSALGHEEVILVRDESAGLRAVIAIHDTTLGPAAGGTRMQPYPSIDGALVDALRLSKAMTAKAAMAGVERGGGKAVIVGDPSRDKSRALLQAFARVVERLGGRFHTGPDVGIDGRDAAVMARHTRHVSFTAEGASVTVADLTALGVLEAMRSVARRLGGELRGLRVALQGLGQVGLRLARLLAGEGVRLTVCDVDARRAERATAELDASRVAPDEIYDVEADVFSPNALGGVLSDATLPRLRVQAVCGAANEQLEEPRHGDELHRRGILYAPDYVVNAGGLLSLLFELGEVDEEGIVRRVTGIGERVSELLERAVQEAAPPFRVADGIVEERLREARAAHGRP
ncbi:MAG TPA: Glu/Leu/Phe/Val dehydrogenase dimerization domain-containing protein [Vicinamibacteria bacterium]|nr:Glu/Leu/Phe/Val dehydrogenase dimerization domain-containing protein [Vicinamibacteria bacterium]